MQKVGSMKRWAYRHGLMLMLLMMLGALLDIATEVTGGSVGWIVWVVVALAVGLMAWGADYE